jgi:hypothetical protein
MGIMENYNFQRYEYKASTDPGVLTPTLTAIGVIADVAAGEAIAAGDLLYYKEADTEFLKAAYADATLPASAIALGIGANGGMVKALLNGYLKSTLLGTQNRATGTITINGNVADNEYFTLAGEKYVFTTDGTITGDVAVDISGGLDKATAQAALLAALSTTFKSKFAYGSFAADVLTLYAKYPTYKGTAGNALTLVKSGTNLAVSAGTLASGNDGGRIWTGAAGAIVYAAPASTNWVNPIGIGLSADEILFQPGHVTPVVGA